MSETPISPLRRRVIEDMSLRNFGEKTQNELRVFVPRSRRKSSVGATRARALLVGRSYIEISGERG